MYCRIEELAARLVAVRLGVEISLGRLHVARELLELGVGPVRLLCGGLGRPFWFWLLRGHASPVSAFLAERSFPRFAPTTQRLLVNAGESDLNSLCSGCVGERQLA